MLMEALAYFDNAATTFPKPKEVYDFADSFYRNCGGNIGRGGNVLAVKAGKIQKEAKFNLLKMYGCEDRQAVFTSSATDALNRIILGLSLEAGDRVCVSPFEHNAVTRTLHHLAKERGIIIEILPFNKKTLLPDTKKMEQQFEELQPKLVVLTHASNVCGAVLPIEDICALSKETCGANTVIDMSQTAGLLPLNISGSSVDFAVFAGHKTLFAPFGVGGFFCKKDVSLQPVFFGGNGIDSIEQDMPVKIDDMIQIGSQNTYAIAGLKASTDWILEERMENLRNRENTATHRLLEILKNQRGINIVANEMQCERIGVVSCLFDGYSPDEVEMLLGKFKVAVRSGIQCAPYAHRFLGTMPAGTVRFSVNPLMDEESFVILEKALYEIMEI